MSSVECEERQPAINVDARRQLRAGTLTLRFTKIACQWPKFKATTDRTAGALLPSRCAWRCAIRGDPWWARGDVRSLQRAQLSAANAITDARTGETGAAASAEGHAVRADAPRLRPPGDFALHSRRPHCKLPKSQQPGYRWEAHGDHRAEGALVTAVASILRYHNRGTGSATDYGCGGPESILTSYCPPIRMQAALRWISCQLRAVSRWSISARGRVHGRADVEVAAATPAAIADRLRWHAGADLAGALEDGSAADICRGHGLRDGRC